MATVLDPEQLDRKERGPRTYALRVELVDHPDGPALATFYKFGQTSTSVVARFRGEPAAIRVSILKVWFHGTLLEAKEHEDQLFKRYRPTCLFEGFPPCPATSGPLCSAKGNTELFLANRLGGEPDFKLPLATFWEDYTFNGHLRFNRAYLPKETIIHSGRDRPAWLDWLQEPSDDYLFLPEESAKKAKLIFVRENYLFDFRDFAASERKRKEFQEQAKAVGTFDEAKTMSGIA